MFIPDTIVPAVPNPTVESTVITEDPTGTSPMTFDFYLAYRIVFFLCLDNF